jgi:DNA-binding LytR/AlgR family response regulator
MRFKSGATMKKKIFIIDDDKDLFRNTSALLIEENFDVICCSDSRQGINLVKQLKPDLIICDIMMQGIDGYEVLKELRKDDLTSAIPIILTADIEKSDLRKGMELGADDYLFKPYNNHELLHAIKTRLNRFEIIKTNITENNDNGKKYRVGENILFKLHSSTIIIAVERIIYIAAKNQYTSVVLDDNRQVIIRKSIAKWESLLPGNVFLRIHRSTIINIKYIGKIENSNNKHFVILKNTSKSFEISQRYFRKLNYRYNINSVNFNQKNLAY